MSKSIAKGSKWVGQSSAEVVAEVVSVLQADGIEYITYLRDGWAGRSVQTLARSGFLDSFKEKADFFIVGGTYKYKWSNTTYPVQSVHDISKPVCLDSRKPAVAIAISRDDKRQMTTLDLGSFRDMVKV